MPAITIYTKTHCPYCALAKRLLEAKGQTWTEINIEDQPEKKTEMMERSGRKTVPQIWIGERHVGGFDDLSALEASGELATLLGLQGKKTESHSRVVIIGSGPAGYTAAIYTARAELKPVAFAGLMAGGQLMLTTEIENYPGFPEGIKGPELMEFLQKQAERFGTQIFLEDVEELDCSQRPFRIRGAEHSYTADAVIIATGASARWLGIDSEQTFLNRGVSACATCDGAFFKDKPVAIVGGGDTALEEAMFLTRYATKVTLIHRRDQLRASKIMQERAFANKKIEFVWDSAIEQIFGDKAVQGIKLRNVKTGVQSELAVEGVFIAIGHKPNTEFLKGQLALDAAGYIQVKPGTSHTSVEGVFACGDVMDPTYRQAITAAGTGCMAAIDAERWLAEKGFE